MTKIAILAIITTICILYCIGAVISSPFKKEKLEEYYDTFTNLVVGFIAITTLYAIIRTKGNTILSVLILIIICYIKTHQFQIKNINLNIKPLIAAIVLGILVYFFYYYISCVSAATFNILHFDDVYYSTLSSKIAITGHENSSSIYSSIQGASPYHYIELWFVSLLVKIFNLTPIFTFSIVTKAILTSNVIIGMIALTRAITKSKTLSFFSIFSVCIAYILIDYTTIWHNANNINNLKELTICPLLILFVVLTYKKSKDWYYPLLIIPILNIGTTPVCFTSLGCTFLFLFFKQKESRKELLYSTIILILVSTGIIVFYIIQSRDLLDKTSTSIAETLNYCFNIYHITNFGNIIYRNLANYCLYIPYFLPLGGLVIYNFFYNKNENKKLFQANIVLIIFFIFSTCIGISFIALFYPFVRDDSGQLHDMINIHLLNIFVWYTFAIVYKEITTKRLKTIFFIFILCTLTYNSTIFILSRKHMIEVSKSKYSEEYIENIIQYHSRKNGGNHGGIITKEVPVHSIEVLNAYRSNPLCKEIPFIHFSNLSTYIDSTCLQEYISSLQFADKRLQLFWIKNKFLELKKDPFYIYSYNKDKELDMTIDSLRLLYIKQNNIEFLSIDADVQIPQTIQKISDTTFIDKNTGERFLFLKKNIH